MKLLRREYYHETRKKATPVYTEMKKDYFTPQTY